MEIEEKPIWNVKYQDEYFPIKDKDGKPAYREHQQQAILDVVKIMNTDKKFVALDGPVGSGKSVINYSIARCFDNAVYITSQKQLQDQIINEKWPDTRMLKGKNAYQCNYCLMHGKDFVSCAYTGSEHKMCFNTESSVPINTDDFVASIQGMIELFRDDKEVLISRSSFRPGDDVMNIIASMTGSSLDDFSLTSTDVIDRMRCKLANIECPIRSARFFINRVGIKVLNPDVYHNMNSIPMPYFLNSDLMIIDECHGVDSFIQRIFGSTIPVDFLNDVYGIDMTPLCECALPSEFAELFMDYYKEMLGPTMVAGRILDKIGNVYEFKENNEFFSIHKDDDASLALKSAALIAHQNNELVLKPFSCLMSCFNGEESDDNRLKEFHRIVRELFVEECKSTGCDTEINFIREFYRNPVTVPLIVSIQEVLKDFCKNAMIVIKMTDNGLPIFIHHETYERRSKASRSFEGHVGDIMRSYPDNMDRLINIVPVNIGAILNRFFFSNARKVLLSTGTWVDPEGALKTLGIDLKDVGVVKVPSTFPRESRPIYVIRDDGFTDFSEKIMSEYVYKTQNGEIKFCDELQSVVELLRAHIKHVYNENANILVHCFSFDIAKRIARSYKGYDDSVLIHLPYGDRTVNVNGLTVPYYRKEVLLDMFMGNKNSGFTLISPSIQEGVDFKHSIARAQIILKSPIPNVGEPYIKTHMRGNEDLGIKKDYSFLDRCIYTSVSQQYGRIVRAKNDWGITVVMDQSLSRSISGLLMAQNSVKLKKMNINYLVTGVQGRMGGNGIPIFKNLFTELKVK